MSDHQRTTARCRTVTLIDIEPKLECECKFRASFDDDFMGPLRILRELLGELHALGGRIKTAVYFERDGRLQQAGLTLRCSRRLTYGLRFQLKQILELRGAMRVSFEHSWNTDNAGLDLTDPFQRRLPVLAPAIAAAFDVDELTNADALRELRPAASMRVMRTAWIAMLPERRELPMFKVLLDRVQLIDLRVGVERSARYSELELELDQEYPRAYELAQVLAERFADIGYPATVESKCSEMLRC